MKHQITVIALKCHDAEAWTAFYRCHVRPLWQFTRRRLNQETEAEDAVSETFMAAIKSIERYDPAGGSLEGWLYGIARRKVADRLRAAYRLRLILTPHPPDQAGNDSRTEDVTTERVRQTLARMSAQQRDVLLWMHRDQLSVRQIAARLNRTEKAAENLLYRARLRFRELYEPKHQPQGLGTGR
ncbi:MAG: sigma-70 family RNA polymerase sigma factor [Phycisphaeraceae bacterium]|nr:sigma-70 family RNA polymerase sigma factor [Phycisphaeraceae bacterium]